MKHKILSLMLVAALALSLTVPALAAEQTFSDVPESYWGYADIEAVSKAGYMKGVGGGRFSPENKVTVAQFLTLLGRLVFPNVKADGADWYGPYVTAAKDAGLLTGSQVDTNNLEAEITRYDMAVILRAAAKKLGVAEKSAQSSEVTDYGMIPNMYTEAVLAVYGMGLIKGVGGGNFNGTETMRRAEVATVIMRLARAVPGGITSTTKPDSEKPEDTQEPFDPEIVPMPDGEEMVSYDLRVRVIKDEHIFNDWLWEYDLLPNVPLKLYYTPDAGKTAVLIAEFKSPAQAEEDGYFEVSFEVPKSWAAYEADKGVFFSAETEQDGEHLVTSDLKTDGRARLDLRSLNYLPSWDILLTPPEEDELVSYHMFGHLQQTDHAVGRPVDDKRTVLPDVAFKVYYTEDGGATSALVYEGRTGSSDDFDAPYAEKEGCYDFLLRMPRDAFSDEGKGIWFSAKTELDGKSLVTSDLRTDGRAYKDMIQIGRATTSNNIELTPPDGEKARFTFRGYVEDYVAGKGMTRMPNVTVRLSLVNGTLLGEAISEEDGTFSMECEVDELDEGFNVRKKIYYVTATGENNGGATCSHTGL